MTIGEFKAFLEGMEIEGAPTPRQWARIVEKIEALEPIRLEPSRPTYAIPSVLDNVPRFDTLRPGDPSWFTTTCGDVQ